MKEEFQITIITVSFNAEKEIRRTIESVVKQNFLDKEYLIIDGGSTDKTVEIIQEYEPKIDYFISEKDGGIYHAMNKAIKLSKGTYINFLNAGDEFTHSMALSEISRTFNSSLDISYGAFYKKINIDDEWFTLLSGKNISKTSLLKSVPICHQTMFVKKELFFEIGLYSEDFKIIADHEWLTRYFKFKGSLDAIGYREKPHIYYLLGGESFKKIHLLAYERIKIALRHYSGKDLIVSQMSNLFFGGKVFLLIISERLGILSVFRKMKFSPSKN